MAFDLILRGGTIIDGTGSAAYAADSEGASGNPVYVFPGTIYAGAVQNAPPVATAQSGQAIHTFVTRSANQGTYLFPPAQGGNG